MNNNNLNTQNNVNSSSQVSNATSGATPVSSNNIPNNGVNQPGSNGVGPVNSTSVISNPKIVSGPDSINTQNVNPSIVNNPQNPVSTPEYQSPNDFKIEETTTTKSQKGTSVIAQITDAGVNVLTDKLPEAIDISTKYKKTIEKNGKKVKIMTKRELITNIILSVVFILIICGGGYGVYYYLFQHNPRNFEVKDITLEYGETIPQSVLSYINLTDISEPDYTLDISNVKTDIGTYTYKVSYGNTVKTGTIRIEDTTAPEVTFKDKLEFAEGTTITKDMLVSECSDISDCTYDLTSPVDTSNPGNIEVSITATDNLGNQKEYPITIKIYEKLVEMICNKSELDMERKVINVNEYDAYFNTAKIFKNGKYRDIIAIIGSDNYDAVKSSYSSNGYTIDDEKKQATKENTIDNISNLTNQEEIKSHLESNGYTCKIVE